MENKIVCDACKGTKVYQVLKLEFEDCTKCKGYTINTDKILEGRSMKDFKDLKISKELLSEVLGISTILMNPIIESENKVGYLVYGSQNTPQEVRNNHKQINIYEFAFKCKKWIANKGYSQLSGKDNIYEKRMGFVCSIGSTTLLIKDFYADTEIEAIIKACEHILNEVSK